MNKIHYVSIIALAGIIMIASQNTFSYAQTLTSTPEQLEFLKAFRDFNSTMFAQAEVSMKNPDTGYLMILSTTNWTATVLDSGLDSVSQDGSKNSVIEFECVLDTGTYSLSVQKDTEEGFLFLGLIQNGNIKDDAGTKAAYGIASLSGTCGEAEGKFK